MTVHGWIYGVHDGRVKDLDVTMGRGDSPVEVFGRALKRYPRGPERTPDEAAGE